MKSLSPEMRRRMLTAFRGLSTTPRQGDIKKLQGSAAEYRLRVGDWRALFAVDHERRSVRILAVLHRGAAYRD